MLNNIISFDYGHLKTVVRREFLFVLGFKRKINWLNFYQFFLFFLIIFSKTIKFCAIKVVRTSVFTYSRCFVNISHCDLASTWKRNWYVFKTSATRKEDHVTVQPGLLFCMSARLINCGYDETRSQLLIMCLKQNKTVLWEKKLHVIYVSQTQRDNAVWTL